MKTKSFFISLIFVSVPGALMAQLPYQNPAFSAHERAVDLCGRLTLISRMQWQSSKDNVLRGYDFTYDGLNRLEESTYGEGADMSQSKNHYSEHVLSYSPNGSIERLQRYGKKNNGTLSYNADLQRNKYVGKEFDHIHGLDLYDHGARMYDAARIVWDRVDGLSEKSYRLCPYLYGQNNPVRFVDKDGFVAIAYDENAKRNILNTLTKEERAFVNFEKNGMIDVSLINRYEGSSENFEALSLFQSSCFLSGFW